MMAVNNRVIDDTIKVRHIQYLKKIFMTYDFKAFVSQKELLNFIKDILNFDGDKVDEETWDIAVKLTLSLRQYFSVRSIWININLPEFFDIYSLLEEE